MNNEEEYRIEQFDEKRFADLEKLYISVYPKKDPPPYFKKKYTVEYAGVLPVAFIAYKQQIPVAFIAAISCFIGCDDKQIVAAQLVDGMTHPRHRHRGLYSLLCERCFSLCKQKGIELMYAFPNQVSYQPTKKLGWELTEHIERFTIPVPVGLLKKILKKTIGINPEKVLENYLIHENGIKSSVLNDGFYGVLRDKQYLLYKQYSKTLVLKIGDSKIWISVRNDLFIGDMETSGNDFETAIKTTMGLASRLGCRAIHFQICQETRLHKLFKLWFESIPSFPVIFKVFNDSIDIKKIKFTLADIDIF